MSSSEADRSLSGRAHSTLRRVKSYSREYIELFRRSSIHSPEQLGSVSEAANSVSGAVRFSIRSSSELLRILAVHSPDPPQVSEKQCLVFHKHRQIGRDESSYVQQVGQARPCPDSEKMAARTSHQ